MDYSNMLYLKFGKMLKTEDAGLLDFLVSSVLCYDNLEEMLRLGDHGLELLLETCLQSIIIANPKVLEIQNVWFDYQPSSDLTAA
jgi:hypothetical protein